MMPTEKDTETLYKRLVIISKLLAMTFVKDMQSQQEKVKLLDEAGLSPYEIGDLLEIKPVTVSVTLFNIRKKAKVKKGR